MELIELQKQSAYASYYKESQGVSDATASFMGAMASHVGEDVLETMASKNAAAGNRGYFANRAGGGIKGDNDDNANRDFTISNLDSWEKLDGTIKKYLELGGMDEETYNKNRKDANGIETIYQAYRAGLTTEGL